MIVIDIKETIKRIFTDFIERKGLRRTPERFAIVDIIYSIQGGFDIDSLSEHLQRKKIKISKATLYNTIDLLVECELIKKQSHKGLSRYEKSYECIQRDHLICTNCGEVIEFCDPRIEEIQTTASRLMNFDIHHYSLHIYGVCEACRAKMEENRISKSEQYIA